VVRDLSNPPKYGDPDHMLKSMSGDGVGLRVLPQGKQPNCNTNSSEYNDCGYVHTNSGIHNKAAFLAINGGVFNGRSIAGIGQAKAELLFYYLVIGLTSNAQLIDARDRAVYLAGAFTQADRCAVKNAYKAFVGIDPRENCL
jgi:Zn-dependent metalloprotease